MGRNHVKTDGQPNKSNPPSSAKTAARSAFWSWFLENSDQIHAMANPNSDWDLEDRHVMFQRLSARLDRVHPNLSWEMDGALDPCLFVIGSGGNPAHHDEVEALVRAAPPLPPCWRLQAFAEAVDPALIHPMTEGGLLLDPQTTEFGVQLSPEGAGLGIVLYVADRDSMDDVDERLGFELAQHFLMKLLGEKRLGAHIVQLHIEPFSADPDVQRWPAARMADVVDQMAGSAVLSEHLRAKSLH